jgi:hypothetical protein
MTIKEAILKSLDDIKKLTNYSDVYKHIVKNGYYNFKEAKTPTATISALLGDFIRKGDTRVKRIKESGGSYSYYLTKNESYIGIDTLIEKTTVVPKKRHKKESYDERDLHILLTSYLKNADIYTKTIFHEQSSNSKDNHQKWVHPDIVGIQFLNLQTKASQAFLRAINRVDTFKLTSYELKKEINSDYELKKMFFSGSFKFKLGKFWISCYF